MAWQPRARLRIGERLHTLSCSSVQTATWTKNPFFPTVSLLLIVNMADTVEDTVVNPDVLTKYRTAASIALAVLEEVKSPLSPSSSHDQLCANRTIGWLADGEKIIDLCERGDELVEKRLGTGECNA